MKKSLFGLIVLFLLLSTYKPNFNLISNSELNIKKIIIQNNVIVDDRLIKKYLNFLYKKNLFFLNTIDIENELKKEPFVESFSIKKIYPSTLKITIIEKKPVATLQNKKKKFYISNKGKLINFRNISRYSDLPTVFGSGENFYSLYKELQKIRFPMETLKAFYFFESGRWDLKTVDNKIIKLPVKNYLSSLKNFMNSKEDKSFYNYKIFDYRIQDQIIQLAGENKLNLSRNKSYKLRFVVGKYDDNQNLDIHDKIVIPNTGIKNSKFVNIIDAKMKLKKPFKHLKTN